MPYKQAIIYAQDREIEKFSTHSTFFGTLFIWTDAVFSEFCKPHPIKQYINAIISVTVIRPTEV